MAPRILIIRFSSFGDIVQSLDTAYALKEHFPGHELDWLVRSDFAQLLSDEAIIDRTISFDRKAGLSGLLRLALQMRRHKYRFIYDAHNNLRSRIVCWVLRPGFSRSFARFPKKRFKKWLWLVLRYPAMPLVQQARINFLAPLQKKFSSQLVPRQPSFSPSIKKEDLPVSLPASYIVFAPSSAWPLKRWPLSYWKRLSELCKDTPVVVIGGPSDDFCADIASAGSSGQHMNLAGQLTLVESCVVIAHANLVVAADTGALHVADAMGTPAIALMGPVTWSYPLAASTTILEAPLPCRPCTKDGRQQCYHPVYKKCLFDLTPTKVFQTMEQKGL